VVAEIFHDEVKGARQGSILMMIEIMSLRVILHSGIDHEGVEILQILTGRFPPENLAFTQSSQQNAYRQKVISMRAARMNDDFIHKPASWMDALRIRFIPKSDRLLV
jgi:hypothetical protein